MVADFENDLEDIILARSRTKDAKTKEKRAELASKEAEILWNESVGVYGWNDGELTWEVSWTLR